MTENTEWFVDWFNSPYYHVLYKNRDKTEAKLFLKNLSSSLGFTPADKLLDLACGKGRHAIYLNQKGFQVTGLDLSPENIKEAAIESNDRLDFHVHDMRETYTGTFNYILNLFTSFGYFNDLQDNLKVLQSCQQMLAWEGKLVIDFFNADLVKSKLVAHEVKVIDGIEFHINKRIENNIIYKDIEFTDLGRDFHFTEKVQALTLADFQQLFKLSGFELINTFGDYNLCPYQSEQSTRLILVAKSITT